VVAIGQPPSGGQAWLTCPAGRGGTVAWVEDPVDPHHELAVSNAAWVRGFDLKIGGERPIGHHHRSGRYQGAVRDGLPRRVSSRYLIQVIYPPGLTRRIQIGLGLFVVLIAAAGYGGHLRRHWPARAWRAGH